MTNNQPTYTNYDQLNTQEKCKLICDWMDYLEGNQKVFAEKLKIHGNTTSHWRSNRHAPGRDTINLLKKVYDISMAQYLAGPPKTPFKESIPESLTIPTDYARTLSRLEEKYKLPGNILVCAMIKVFDDWKEPAQRSFLARYFHLLGEELNQNQEMNQDHNDSQAVEPDE